LLTIAASLSALACSDDAAPRDAAGQPDRSNDALIFPEGLSVSPRAGGNGVFNLTALTLHRGPSSGELYVALRNDGDAPACSPALSVEILDKTEQSLAAGIGGLLVRRFYRLTDGSGTIAACVGPGDVTMVAITDLPMDLVLEDVGQVVYSVSYWNLALAPLGEISVTRVRSVKRDGGVAYAGVLVNGLDVGLSSPAVAIFPVNRGGRPLGVAYGRGSVEVLPGASWEFETNIVSQPEADFAAYPANGP
jgi:hypothetical protein